jgi:hypothetical protein
VDNDRGRRDRTRDNDRRGRTVIATAPGRNREDRRGRRDR